MSLEIERPANFDKLRIIQAAGIKQIRLGVSLDSPSFQRLDQIRDKGMVKILLNSIRKKDKKLLEAAKESLANFQVTISIPQKGKIASGDWVENIAQEAFTGDEEYRIETNDGKIITPEAISISKKTKLEPFGKTVFRSDAVRKLLEFKNDFLDPKRDW